MQRQKGMSMVGKRQALRDRTVQSLVMVLLTFAGATSVLAQPSASPASPPILQPQPLLSEQRLARAEYWFSRRGLLFGVPPGAYDTAATERHVMELRQAGAATQRLSGNSLGKRVDLLDS